jgi:hypothetical protein
MKTDIAQTVGVEVRMMTGGQLKDLCTTAVQGIPAEMTFEVANDGLSRKAEFIAYIRAFFPNPADLADPVKQWGNFYQKYLGLTVDLSGVKIPERTAEQAKEFTRLIIVACGLTRNQIYSACQKQFTCYKYIDDLDASITVNERDSKTGSYAIWVRDTVEADEVHQNKSADMVAKEKLTTETLLERMIHELKYFAETGKHLDLSRITLCSGSRGSGGNVPSAYWYDGRFRVRWYDAGDRHASLRPREAVTL